jgi:hypothetical protein
MSTDYQVLLSKFNKFREYIKTISKDSKVIQDYEKMTDNEFILFGLGFLVPNKEKLDIIVNQVAEKLKVTEEEHKNKIKRYLECFIEYLQQIQNPQEAFTKTAVNIINAKSEQ